MPVLCPAGTYSTTAGLVRSAQCIACPAGSSCGAGAIAPTPCTPGFIAAARGATKCTACEAGTFQNNAGATACLICDAGRYCTVGTPVPVPCPGGTYSNRTGVSRPDNCLPVPLNFWAPLGSANPQSCRDLSGFYCPGRLFDEVNAEPGSLPIKFETGQTLNYEVASTRQLVSERHAVSELTVEGDMSTVDEAALRLRLATIFGVPVDSVQLELTPGSVIVSFSIASPSNDPDGATRTAQELSELSTSNVSALTVLLGVPVAEMAPVRVVNVTRSVLVEVNASKGLTSCPLGHCEHPEARILPPIHLSVLPHNPLWPHPSLARTCVCAGCTAGAVVPCERGTYNPTTGAYLASDCRQCPAHSNTNSSGAVYLTDCRCNAGYIRIVEVVDGANVTSCVCPAGFEQLSAGSSYFCSPCQRGRFKDVHGNTLCTTCPFEHATSLELGAVSDEQCCCDFGFFMPANGTFASNSSVGAFCVACPEASTACTERGTTPPSIPLRPGYWRIHEWSVAVVPCFTQGACVGTNLTGKPDTSLCAIGHEGLFCDSCELNYVKAGSGACTACTGSIALTMLPAALLVVGLAMATIAYAFSPAARKKLKLSMIAITQAFHAYADEADADTNKLDLLTSAVEAGDDDSGDNQEPRQGICAHAWSLLLGWVARLTAAQVKFKIIIVCTCSNPSEHSH